MKKAYILLSTLVLIVLFSFLAKESLEKNALHNRVVFEKLNYIQAKAHLLFLESYFISLNEDELKKFESFELFIDDFLLTIKKLKRKEGYIFVASNEKLQIRVVKVLEL